MQAPNYENRQVGATQKLKGALCMRISQMSNELAGNRRAEDSSTRILKLKLEALCMSARSNILEGVR